ncbi:glycosyltransferase family protein [Glutamicibacter ardleyensis]|uniref:glycosyltransferase family protein n=1 Tax=Glutamicibacter ardleyensis TaxID=225894 RepID=UPI003FCFA05C
MNLGRARNSIRVATILDDFSQVAWGAEWDLELVTPENWRQKLETGVFELLFVESAWNGNSGAWKYHLTGPSAPRLDLTQMVSAFRSAGIPTVFWNKEDPPHYSDFLDTARLFDTVLTSDSSKIIDYRADLGHERIASLSFAAQPEVHNPVRARAVDPKGVAFAGMYFAHKYPERREQLQLLLDGAIDSAERGGEAVSIFSRQLGQDANYQFPTPYAQLVVGSLPYSDMVPAYQDFVAFLNANSVVDSPSMCARRIFEISACGTPVVSAPSKALPTFFAADEVFEVADAQQASQTLRMLSRSPEQRDRSVHLAQRRIWSGHSYAHRAQAVMDAAGLEQYAAGTSVNKFSMATTRRVSVVAATRRPEQLAHMLATIGAQAGVELQLILVTHGFAADPNSLKEARSKGTIRDLVSVVAAEELSLGQCLNLGVERSDGDFVAKMDDDDFYGVNYLADQINSLRFSGADLVGKQAHYMYLSGSNRTLLRMGDREHRFTDVVMGPTLLGTREIFTKHHFANRSRGEDTEFLTRIGQEGASIYSADRFNFVQMRSVGAGHTWQADDRELAQTGVLQWFGRNDQHVFF